MVVQIESVLLSRVPKLQKKMNQFLKFSTRDMGVYWFEKLFLDHFKPSARLEFQHMPREQNWLETKRVIGRGQGKRDDLVFTGKSRRFLSVGPVITNTSRSVTVRLSGPLYFKNPKHTTPGHPDKPEEVTRVSKRHRNLLARRFSFTISGLVSRFLRHATPEQVKSE